MDCNFIAAAQRTIAIESKAIEELHSKIDASFSQACQIILDCKARVIITGMGKSGHIGKKIAATLASTGTPSFFVHPAEASHGDMGMITALDIIVAISNSGSTDEVINLLPIVNRMGVKLISMTGNKNSILARASIAHLDISVISEACPLNLAPTSSTTAALVMGDALAIALLEARNFTPEDFAASHPGGALGRNLLLRVTDIMHTGKNLPQVLLNAPISQAIVEMSAKSLGMTAVIDANNKLVGIFTDGDLRRIFVNQDINIHTTKIKDVMTKNCKTIGKDDLAIKALNMMNKYAINVIIVAVEDQIMGALNMHDLLKAKII